VVENCYLSEVATCLYSGGQQYVPRGKYGKRAYRTKDQPAQIGA